MSQVQEVDFPVLKEMAEKLAERLCHHCQKPFSPRVLIVCSDPGEQRTQEWCAPCVIELALSALKMGGTSNLECYAIADRKISRVYGPSISINVSKYQPSDVR